MGCGCVSMRPLGATAPLSPTRQDVPTRTLHSVAPDAPPSSAGNPAQAAVQELAEVPHLATATQHTRLHRLAAAVRRSDLDAIRVLLHNATVEEVNGYFGGRTALHVACERAEVPAVVLQHLLRAGADANLGTAMYGYTPLHIAAERGDIQKLEVLTAWHAVDLQAVNAAGGTPLTIATSHRRLAAAALLERCINRRREEVLPK